MKDKWSDFKSMSSEIIWVEIRTENKGVMGLPLDDFDVKQIDCLCKHWKKYNHLSEFNRLCFGTKLVDPVIPR